MLSLHVALPILGTAKDNQTAIATEPVSALRDTLASQPVAMADTRSVPAGKYGKAALEKLGLWGAVRPHVVAAENVRAALALVERGADRKSTRLNSSH